MDNLYLHGVPYYLMMNCIEEFMAGVRANLSTLRISRSRNVSRDTGRTINK